jgi:hypothetical protein
MSEDRIREILNAFEIIGSYKREEVHAAIELREEITPFLIEIVESIASNPSEYVDREGYFAHIYAIMLLGHFREPGAHESIVKLAGLPEDLADKLLGDMITEDLSVILYRTCGGSLESIKCLAMKEDANDYSRNAAFDAMVFAVADGMVAREEVVSFFSAIFDHLIETDSSSDVLSFLADAARDLYPVELMEKLKAAYEKDLIDEWTVSYEDQEDALEGSVEISLKEAKRELEARSLDSLDEKMSWWACFDPHGEIFARDADIERSHRKKSKKSAKTKRKTAKASRKKNRRR